MNTYTTLAQLGGNAFLTMTGCKIHSMIENLSLRLPKNKSNANHLVITLDESDTYTMNFFRQGTLKEGFAIFEVETIDGVYCDNLQDVFKHVTGLDTKL